MIAEFFKFGENKTNIKTEIVAGIFGSRAGTAYIVSAAGIEEGGRTGFTAVISVLLFHPFIFFLLFYQWFHSLLLLRHSCSSVDL